MHSYDPYCLLYFLILDLLGKRKLKVNAGVSSTEPFQDGRHTVYTCTFSYNRSSGTLRNIILVSMTMFWGTRNLLVISEMLSDYQPSCIYNMTDI